MVSLKLGDNECLLRSSRATRRLNMKGVNGKLFLTDKRLIFKSYLTNYITHEESILLAEIERPEAKLSGLISGRLALTLKNGNKEIFFLRHRKKWFHDIQKAMQA